jgi:hypothetical protein
LISKKKHPSARTDGRGRRGARERTDGEVRTEGRWKTAFGSDDRSRYSLGRRETDSTEGESGLQTRERETGKAIRNANRRTAADKSLGTIQKRG